MCHTLQKWCLTGRSTRWMVLAHQWFYSADSLQIWQLAMFLSRSHLHSVVHMRPSLSKMSYQVMKTWIYCWLYYRRVKVPSVRSILYSTTWWG
jgi:hypothetical protein